MDYLLRVATRADLPGIRALIPRSVRGLNHGLYSPAQLDSSLEHLFGADTQLIEDGTYFAIEQEGRLLACGGWSGRRTLFGGDQHKAAQPGGRPGVATAAREADALLDPSREPARIRAFFVDPAEARRGLGRLLLETCVSAARQAGFRALELGSTLPGEQFYARAGFRAVERLNLPLPGGEHLPLVRMRLDLA